MPVNKNALKRYLVIDEKLRSNRRYNLKELAEACTFVLGTTVESRTISADLKEMREQFAAPIPKRPDDGRFSYTNRRFSIMTSPLKDEELLALKNVLTILNDFQDLPQFQGIQSIILNLESRANSADEKMQHKKVLSFDRSVLHGIGFLKVFYDGIVQEQPLHVTYKPYEGDKHDAARFEEIELGEIKYRFTFTFHAYFLKEFNHRWFVFGFNEIRKSIDCYAIDRFTVVKPMQFKPYEPNQTIDYATYFDHIIGVTNTEARPVETFQMRFKTPRAFYVRSKKWKSHQSEIEETDDSITFEWQLKYNRELEARVLEFGQDVEVLTPQWFREKIAQIWQNALKNHSVG